MALIFIGIPFVVRAVQPVLEKLDPSYEEAAGALGANRGTIFRKVILPEIIPPALTGFDYNSATAIALVMLAFSFAILFIVNLIQARNTKILKGGR